MAEERWREIVRKSRKMRRVGERIKRRKHQLDKAIVLPAAKLVVKIKADRKN